MHNPGDDVILCTVMHKSSCCSLSTSKVFTFNSLCLQLYGLPVPAHWLRDFFLAAGSLELLLTDDALAYYTNLSQVGFGSSSYIHSQLALVHYHTKGIHAV